MVCMLGRGRMAAMVRLLKVGSFQEITRGDSEVIGHEPFQVIHCAKVHDLANT